MKSRKKYKDELQKSSDQTIDKIKISFRVNSPYKDVKLNIYQGNTLIKQLPKPYLVPAEMENVLLDKSLITSDEDIKVEVSCD